jgi:hypothetical protein
VLRGVAGLALLNASWKEVGTKSEKSIEKLELKEPFIDVE